MQFRPCHPTAMDEDSKGWKFEMPEYVADQKSLFHNYILA